jgi:NADH:ubiquinone oxidoreductase subunit
MQSLRVVRSLSAKPRLFSSLATQLFQMGTVKKGQLVGEDEFGNKYFENKDYIYGHTCSFRFDVAGRDRWVEYKDKWDFDASTVTPEWHSWLHHIGDLSAPKVRCPRSPLTRRWPISSPCSSLTTRQTLLSPKSPTSTRATSRPPSETPPRAPSPSASSPAPKTRFWRNGPPRTPPSFLLILPFVMRLYKRSVKRCDVRPLNNYLQY